MRRSAGSRADAGRFPRSTSLSRHGVQDRQPLDGGIVRATLGGEALHSRILDSDSLVQQGDREGQASDRDGVDHRASNPTGPALWKWDSPEARRTERQDPVESKNEAQE